MRRLERVVGAPQVGLRVERNYLRKSRRRRVLQEFNAIDVGYRNRVDACDSRQILRAGYTKRAARVLERGGEAGGADLVEAVDERESRAVVHAAEASADHGLVIVAKDFLEGPGIESRGVSDRDSRRPVRRFQRIETRAVVRRTTRIEINRPHRAVANPLVHILYVLGKLSSQAECCRGLQAV